MRLERVLKMRTEDQDFEDLEKRIGARTVDCTGCKKRKWIMDRLKIVKVWVRNFFK